MTTDTLTITDFLLARIESDRGEAQYVLNAMGCDDWPVMAGSVNGAILGTCWSVLAECEAKRRIVELHAKAGAGEWYRGSCKICGESDADYPCSTLRALAGMDAEHADYRDEWR